MGLKDSEWGQMGVTMMAGTLGWIMEAPAAAAYAVLPVGVDTITPVGQRGCSVHPHQIHTPASVLQDLLSGECSEV